MDPLDEELSDALEAEKAPETVPEPSELETAVALAESNKAGWQRATADYANLKREMERTTADLSKYAVAGFIGRLLPVVDSFRKATEQRPAVADEATTKWMDGVELIRAQLDGVLASAGVTAIATAQVPFDPTQHEAMLMQPASDAVPAGTIITVLEPGYMLHEKVIRPAKVIVAE